MQSLRRIAPIILGFFFTIGSVSHISAQGTGPSANFYVIAMLIVIGSLILVSAVMLLSENFIQIESRKAGLDLNESNRTFVQSFKEIWTPKGPAYTNGAEVIDLNKGHDILLNGIANKQTVSGSIQRFSIKPGDFRELAPIPRMKVQEGDEVKAGDVLFHDKKDEKVKYVAPVSGEVVEIRRGDKRAITDVVILADKEIRYKQFDPPSLTGSSREEIVDYLCESGGWTLINQRPYDIVPDVQVIPKGVFISTFDSAPLAPDLGFVVQGRENAFQKGIDTLARLSNDSVHLGLDARSDQPPAKAFTHAQNCQLHWFRGKHPIGNVGIQIHHIAPIKAGDTVWTLTVDEVIILGDLMHKGIYNAERKVAITGACVKQPAYIQTYQGANIGELLKDQLSEGKNRIIDGNPLSGKKSSGEDFIGHKTIHITVIEEGDQYEMFGWLLPLTLRPTISKTFPNFLVPNMKFDGETNTHGERRAFVMTGQYESVLPMDIFPQHLLKAIMANDYERMEGLGITELTEEDLALCEFVCTSKIPVQKILRKGLDMMREQG